MKIKKGDTIFEEDKDGAIFTIVLFFSLIGDILRLIFGGKNDKK